MAGGALAEAIQSIISELACLQTHLSTLEDWWQQQDPDSIEGYGEALGAIAASSDRANLDYSELRSQAGAGLPETPHAERVHPVSGQRRDLQEPLQLCPTDFPGYGDICQYPPEQVEAVFWWFWRFYPEMLDRAAPEDGLLFPSHGVLPDCSLHGYQSTVSALAGARFPGSEQGIEAATHPYLLVFTFSPIQEFIKSSRKFADFWAGSYLLHYLSVRLCWLIARRYGPDAVIVPSLWGQDIVDALLLKEDGFPKFQRVFEQIQDRQLPDQRFIHGQSNSLSTAGFPNVITAVVPGLEAAKGLGQDLSEALTQLWVELGEQVRDDIRAKVGAYIQDLLDEVEQAGHNTEFGRLLQELGVTDEQSNEAIAHLDDLRRWRPQHQPANAGMNAGQTLYPGWSWRSLWDYQLQNSWEPYWTAIPLGVPGEPLSVARGATIYDQWKQAQSTLAQPGQTIPSEAEENAYSQGFNVGTWWGSLQQRLRVGLQAAKNTRVWAIPSAPGVRSTVSGRFSAVHPSFKYRKVDSRGETRDLREGAGLPQGSMRLFWLLMAKAYPGVFNGSEMLNALEITKRMAWVYGKVADELGIPTTEVKRILEKEDPVEVEEELSSETVSKASYVLREQEQLFYDNFIQFPNLSSVAAGRFMVENPDLVRQYWDTLQAAWNQFELGQGQKPSLKRRVRSRPTHLIQVDNAFNPQQQWRNYYNGVMFSSKWLAEDLGLDREGANQLSGLIDQVHRDVFDTVEGSPSDWWAVVLADGDSMGQYISGTRLQPYRKYLNQSITASGTGLAEALDGFTDLLNTQKRMGPATHVGLNRSLLDFSNRLVPYLTERRFCGRVVYSGGDDVMVLMPLEDLPQYLMSLRAAWCGGKDPSGEFAHGDGYWQPQPGKVLESVPDRPLFTMGAGATMSMGVVIAHKTVPLPTVLEHLWEAESERAKGMPGKDGLCMRVLYSGGNRLEALMNGDLLASWWDCIADFAAYGDRLSPVLYKLAEQLPKRAMVTENSYLFAAAAEVIMKARDEELPNFKAICHWLQDWENWVRGCLREHFAQSDNWEQAYLQVLRTPWQYDPLPLGCHPDDLGQILRFTAFWVDKRLERYQWGQRHD